MDAFAVLGVGRKLEVSDEELREAFREAGKRVHPDAGGGEEEFGEAQRAFELLRSPSRRLRHWLELEGVDTDERGSVSPRVSELFGPVGEVIQQAGELARRREKAFTPLVAAMLEDDLQRSREALEEMLERVEAALAEACAGFSAIQAGASAAEAGETVRTLAFLEKWRGELRAAYTRLAG
jgi:curved DNA-binding protein CbpA